MTARLCLNHNSYLIPFRAILFRRALSLFFLDYASFLRLRLSFFIFLDISRTLTFTFERVLPLKVHASWSMMSFALMAAPHSFFFRVYALGTGLLCFSREEEGGNAQPPPAHSKGAAQSLSE